MNQQGQADLLIDILLDKTESVDIRDDTAMNLQEYDGIRVEAALLVAALDPVNDEMIVASCGESLGILWAKRNHFDSALVKQLPLVAQNELLAIVERMSSIPTSIRQVNS